MKLELTSIKYIIPLLLLSFNAYSLELSDKVAACNAALEQGDLTTATKAADEALQQQSDHHAALLCKGRVLGAAGKYNEGVNVLELATKTAQPGFEQIINYLLIGSLHKNNQKYTEAIANYEKSLKICESVKDNKFKRVNLNLIGQSHALNGDLNAALSSYLAGSKLANNDNERAENFEYLGATYSALGQHDNAIEYQLKGVLAQQKAGTLDDYANASLALGKVYALAKEYPNAENTYNKLIKFAKENGGAYYEAKANYDLAQMKAASGDAGKAKTMMADALKLAKSIGDTRLATEIETSMNKLAN